MHTTPKKVFAAVAERSPVCERRKVLNDHECGGRLTFEHVWKYAGRQVNEPWAIITLCEWAHSLGPYMGTGGLDKRINEYLSRRHLLDLTPDEFDATRLKYPRLFDNWPAIIQF